ncbi:fatty acid-binding protein DegV [Petrotoga sp. 9PW.55.5.1]|uniref:DegV family protein n=1 Tax=Petrotoga sp. 9PW.55.5.1 TaxID=1308979 RepID=UPI000DC36FA8|nr:DegV family protein [Petrotoga sp. 9PW.55.5.1]RAO99405.1 fatty acid-binding protein DegV [Petrotoga sp. 9PW.55.5.1]
MGKIGIIADSGGYLPSEVLEKYDVSLVPFYITLDGENYLVQGKDITDKELYKKMKDDPNLLPKTSAPNPEDWYNNILSKYEKGHKNILITTISSKLSSSFSNANVAKESFEKKYPDCKIKIIDTKTCSGGQAALENKIYEIIEKGKNTIEQLYEISKGLIEKTHTIFTVKSLKYMSAGGRIGGAAKFLGMMLRVNPISEFIEGEVKPIKLARSRKKALEGMADIVVTRISNLSNLIFHTRNALFDEDENYFVNLLKEKLNGKVEIQSGPLESVIGVHGGPGTIGIGFVE